jgi:Uma2 family endonuclease
MTAMPAPRHEPTAPDHPLTIAEYAALGETEPGYTELIEGHLLMSPSPIPDHNFAVVELAIRLRPQLPDKYEALTELDVDLELTPVDGPGFSRRPDLIIVERSARERVRAERGLIRASEVLVVIEVLSPGSRRINKIDKRRDYADARIPWYWIIDITDPGSLLSCQLTDDGGYQDKQRATGQFSATEPFPITLDLTQLY